MDHCCYVSDKSENFRKCYSRSKFGNYCRKHRANHLLDEHGYIRIDRFTGESKDYLIKDIRMYCKDKTLIPRLDLFHKKNILFDSMSHHIEIMGHYQKNLNKVIRVQALRRGRIQRTRDISRKTCNNTEDFYTFDPIQEIPDMYFYSYVDDQGFRWGFDIRSLHNLE